MSIIDPAETFRQEAAELLEQFEQALLDLGAKPGDRELIDCAFRAMHTIKGSGAMFGFTEVAAFTHDFETAFDRLRSTGAEAGERLIGVALAAKDHIRALIEDAASTDRVIGDAILADLHELTGDASAAPVAAAVGDAVVAPASTASRRFRVRIRFAPDILANGANPLLLLDELRGLVEDSTVTADLDRLPDLEALDPTQCHIGWTVELAGSVTPAAIEDVFLFVRDDMDLLIEETERGSPRLPPRRRRSSRPPLCPRLCLPSRPTSRRQLQRRSRRARRPGPRRRRPARIAARPPSASRPSVSTG